MASSKRATSVVAAAGLSRIAVLSASIAGAPGASNCWRSDVSATLKLRRPDAMSTSGQSRSTSTSRGCERWEWSAR
jgi:hypothetical protein